MIGAILICTLLSIGCLILRDGWIAIIWIWVFFGVYCTCQTKQTRVERTTMNMQIKQAESLQQQTDREFEILDKALWNRENLNKYKHLGSFNAWLATNKKHAFKNNLIIELLKPEDDENMS